MIMMNKCERLGWRRVASEYLLGQGGSGHALGRPCVHIFIILMIFSSYTTGESTLPDVSKVEDSGGSYRLVHTEVCIPF